MKDEIFIFGEAEIASLIKNQILKDPNEVANLTSFDDFEFISEMSETKSSLHIAPIMTMNQDEIMEFVEGKKTSELAEFNVDELGKIGKVLGVNPKILVETVE